MKKPALVRMKLPGAMVVLLGFAVGCGTSSSPADAGDSGPADSGGIADGGDGGSGGDAGEICLVPPGGTGAPLGDGGPCQSFADCGMNYCHLPVIHCPGYDFWVASFEANGDCRAPTCQSSADCAADEVCNPAKFCVPDPCAAAVTGVTCLCINPAGNWPYPACNNPPPSSPYGGCPPGCAKWYTPSGALACRCASCPDPDAGYLSNGC